MLELGIVSIYLWIGFVCAISFMEAWLKFRAPGVSLEIGLGIGQLVFKALNRMEWLFALILILVLLFNIETFPLYILGVIIVPVFILLFQTVFLLPNLKRLAQQKIQGLSTKKSSIHIYYIIFELIKVVTLAGIGYMLFKF